MKALYAGPKNPRTSEQIYPGLVASGVEALTANWPLWIWGSALIAVGPRAGEHGGSKRHAGGFDVEDFYRLFMIPGMAHCGGGVGPVRFGNDAAPSPSASSDNDPERDMFTALERWVEQGIAPSRLIGAGPSPISPDETMTRPLCPYPQQTQYKGSGNTNDAANFVCALPAK